MLSQPAEVGEQLVVVQFREVLLLRGHRVRLGVGRRVQQPGRSRGRGVAEGAPDKIAAVLGARQGDVEKPDVFSQAFDPGLLLVRVVIGAAEVADEVAVARLVEEDLFLAAVFEVCALPREGAKDDRVFQPFALVNGDELDGLLVGLQPELVFLGNLALEFPLLAEPLEQAGDAQTMLDAGAVEPSNRMQEVGQPALAVGEGQQAGTDLFALHETAKHLDEAALRARAPR